MMFLTLITAVFPFASAETTAAFGESKFTMGSGKTPDESHAHLVTLSPYKIDLTEVSIQAFEQLWRMDGVTTNIGATQACAGEQKTLMVRERPIDVLDEETSIQLSR